MDKKILVLGAGILAFLAAFYLVFYFKEAQKGEFDEPPVVEKSEKQIRDFADWKLFTSENGAFTASFPKTPGHSSEAVSLDGSKEKGVYSLYVAQEPDGSGVMIRTVKNPQGYASGKEKILIEESFDKVVNSDNRNIAREVIEAKFEGLPALVFKVENPDVMVKGESILDGDTLYTILYVSRVNLYDERVWDHIISSFKIEKK